MCDNRVELLSLFAALFEGFDVLVCVEGSLRSGGAVQGFIDADLLTFGNFHFEAVRVYPAHLGSLDQTAAYAPVDSLAISKRKKDNDVRNIWIRQIACIPTFSETIARALLTHFRSMCDLRDALRSDRFPEVQINASGTVLGRARLKKLREVFA